MTALTKYQLDMLSNIAKNFSSKELKLIASVRHSGKSYLNQLYGTLGRDWSGFVGGHDFNTNYWPHVKMVAWNDVFDAETWCYYNFKGRNWRSRGQYFAFKREQDYTAFLLKWS